MKKVVICLLLLFLLYNFKPICVSEAMAEEADVEKIIEEQTYSQIQEIDFTQLEDCFEDIKPNFIEAESATELVEGIVDGKYTLSFNSIVNSISSSLIVSFRKILPFISIMLGIILLSSIINKIKSQKFDSGVSDIVFFSTYVVLILIISGLVVSEIANCTKVVAKMRDQMSATFPVLLVLMTCSGANASVKMYQPAVAALSGGVSSIFSFVLLPIVSAIFVVSVVSNLSDNVKLNRFQDFLTSAFKWILGAVSTVFMAFLAVNGITSATKDGISIRTAKYAIKNYVPIIGGYVSEGFELVIASSIILKNGIGVLAIIMLISTVLAPIFSIAVLSLSIKLVSAVVEPIADKKFCTFLASTGKILTLLCCVLLGVALMYFLSLALIISTANKMF